MAEGRVLIIAGSDSGGGAGAQADIKTVTALGGYAASAITAVTVQNTLGVAAIHLIPADLVEAQARAVLEDIGADVIKIGMVGEAVAAVIRVLDDWRETPVVVDPVMLAKDGTTLADASAVNMLRDGLLPRAALLTPNAPEAAALTGLAIQTTDDLRRAGEALLALGCRAVLMKGGHIPGDRVIDVLLSGDGETTFEGPRLVTRHT
ncbi:MAG TPA: bifunctional hydroxymethylpyrimidine kinase/phosphomethylpyrimidine kinase, partial [Caulobacteraceae bacterium]